MNHAYHNMKDVEDDIKQIEEELDDTKKQITE